MANNKTKVDAKQNAPTIKFDKISEPRKNNQAPNTAVINRDIKMATRRQKIANRARDAYMGRSNDTASSYKKFRQAQADIEAGEYSLDRISKDMYDTYDDEVQSSFIVPTGDAAKGISSEEILMNGSKGIAKTVVYSSNAQLQSMNKIASQLIGVTTRNAEAQSRIVAASINANVNALNNTQYVTNAKLDAIGSTLKAILDFQNKNTLKFYQKSMEMSNGYSLALQNLQQSMQVQEKNSGRFDTSQGIKAYFEQIGNRALETVMGQFLGGGAAALGKGDTSFLPTAMQFAGGKGGLIRGAAKSVLKSFLPDRLLKRYDTARRDIRNLADDFLEQLYDRLENSRNPIIQSLAPVFGNKRSKISEINLGAYNKGALPWNGRAEKALTEVIPELLTSIDSHIGHQEKRYYNYDTGKFMKESEVRKEFEAAYSDRINVNMNSAIQQLETALAKSGKPIEQVQSTMAGITAQLNDVFAGTTKAADFLSDTVKTLKAEGVDDLVSESVGREFSNNIRAAIKAVNDLTAQIEQPHNVYRNLSNSVSSPDLISSARERHTNKTYSFSQFSKGDPFLEIIDSIERVSPKDENGHTKPKTQIDNEMDNRIATDPLVQAQVLQVLYQQLPKQKEQDAIDAIVASAYTQQYGPDGIMGRFMNIKGIQKARAKVQNVKGFNKVTDQAMRYMDILTGRASTIVNGVTGDSKQMFSDIKEMGKDDVAATKKFLKSIDPKTFFRSFPENWKDFFSQIPTEDEETPLGTGPVIPFNKMTPLGYGPKNKASTFFSKFRRKKRQSKAQETAQRTAMAASVSGMTGADIDRANRNLDKAAAEMNSEESEDSDESAANIQAANSIKTTMSILVGKIGNFGASIFGKEGILKKFFDDKLHPLFDKLFRNEDAIFHNLYGKAKDFGKNVLKDTGTELANLIGINDDSTVGKWLRKIRDKNKKPDDVTTNIEDTTENPEVTLNHVVEETTEDNTAETTEKPEGTLSSVIEETTEKVAETGAHLTQSLMTIEQVAVGDASDPDKIKKKAFKLFDDKFSKVLPKALAGGVVGTAVGLANLGGGLLGGLLLPGGPIAGAIVGSGLSILSQTEVFKSIMFGKLNEQTGEREGGLITKKTADAFKKALPSVRNGAVLGTIGSLVAGSLGVATPGLGILGVQLLPGGVLGGTLIGAAVGLAKNSDKFKDFVFGKADEEGKRSGTWLSNTFNQLSSKMPNGKHLKKLLTGAGFGMLTGAVLRNAGFLPAMLSVGGPIGMGLAGLGIAAASSSTKFNEFIFGSEYTDENGNVKRRKDGLLSRTAQILKVNFLEPIGNAFKKNLLNLVDWTKDAITGPFRLAFGPLLDSIKHIKIDVTDFIKESFTSLSQGIYNVTVGFAKKLFSPVTKVLGYLGKMGISAVTGAAKVALSPVSGILKMTEMLVSPARRKQEKAFQKSFKEYRKTQGAEDALQQYWDAQEIATGSKVNSIQKMVDRFEFARGRGEAAEEFRKSYAQNMGESGFNSIDWMNVASEKKQRRKDRRERNKNFDFWNGDIRKERARIINEDLGGNASAVLTDAAVRDYREKFSKMGINERFLQNSDDIMQLLFNQSEFRQRVEGKGKYNTAESQAAQIEDAAKAQAERDRDRDDILHNILDTMLGHGDEVRRRINRRGWSDQDYVDSAKAHKEAGDKAKAKFQETMKAAGVEGAKSTLFDKQQAAINDDFIHRRNVARHIAEAKGIYGIDFEDPRFAKMDLRNLNADVFTEFGHLNPQFKSNNSKFFKNKRGYRRNSADNGIQEAFVNFLGTTNMVDRDGNPISSKKQKNAADIDYDIPDANGFSEDEYKKRQKIIQKKFSEYQAAQKAKGVDVTSIDGTIYHQYLATLRNQKKAGKFEAIAPDVLGFGPGDFIRKLFRRKRKEAPAGVTSPEVNYDIRDNESWQFGDYLREQLKGIANAEDIYHLVKLAYKRNDNVYSHDQLPLEGFDRNRALHTTFNTSDFQFVKNPFNEAKNPDEIIDIQEKQAELLKLIHSSLQDLGSADFIQKALGVDPLDSITNQDLRQALLKECIEKLDGIMTTQKKQLEETQDQTQVIAQTSGVDIDPGAVDSLSGNRLRGFLQKINPFKKLARKKKQEELAAKEAAENPGAASSASTSTALTVYNPGALVPVSEVRTERKKSFFERIGEGITNVFNRINDTKVGRVALKAGKVGLLSTIALTVAELVAPNAMHKLSDDIKQATAYMNDPEGGVSGLLRKLGDKLGTLWESEDGTTGIKPMLVKSFNTVLDVSKKVVLEWIPAGAKSIGSFISNNIDLVVGAATSVVTELAVPLVELMWATTKSLLKTGWNALFGKKGTPTENDLTPEEARTLADAGINIQEETISGKTKNQAERRARSEGVNGEAVYNPNTGMYEIQNTRALGSNQTVNEKGNTVTISNMDGAETVARTTANMILHPAATKAALKAAPKAVIGAGKLSSTILSKIPIVKPIGNLGKGIFGAADKAMSAAGKVIGKKASEKAGEAVAQEAAEAVMQKAAAETIEATGKVVAKEGAEAAAKEVAQETSKVAFKKILEFAEKLTAESGLIKNLDKPTKGIGKKVITWVANKCIDLINGAKKLVGEKLKKAVNAINAGLAKMAGQTATVVITALITIGGGALFGAIDAPNLFGVSRENIDGTMTLVASLFGAILGVPWIGTFLDVILTIAALCGKDAKRELAVDMYKKLAKDDIEKIQAYEIARDQQETERQLYNALNNTNLDAAAYNDLDNRTVLGTVWNGVKSIFGKGTNNKSTERAYELLINNGYNTSQIEELTKDQTKLNATLASLGYGPGGTAGNIRNQLVSQWKNYLMTFDNSKRMIRESYESNSLGTLSSIDQTLRNTYTLIKGFIVNSTMEKIAEASELGYGPGSGSGAPSFKQGNSKWANMRIGTFANGKKATMKTAGCGPTALSIVANELQGIGYGEGEDKNKGKDENKDDSLGYGPITPAQMGAYAARNGYISNGGANAGLFTYGAARLGMRSRPLGDINAVTRHIASGRPTILAGTGSGGSNPFTRAGHIVVADRVKGSSIRILDPMTGRGKYYNANAVASKTNHAFGYGIGDDTEENKGNIFVKAIRKISSLLKNAYNKAFGIEEQATEPVTQIQFNNGSHDIPASTPTGFTINKDVLTSVSGNDVERYLSTAISQVGYAEKSSNMDLRSFSANAGHDNYSKYAAEFGGNPNPWCAYFVSWVAKAAGIPESIVYRTASSTDMMRHAVSNGIFHYRGEYDPTPGDIIVYNWDKSEADPRKYNDANHVGIVEKVDSNYVYTIEGNSEKESFEGVVRKTRRKDLNNNIGYIHPNWRDDSISVNPKDLLSLGYGEGEDKDKDETKDDSLGYGLGTESKSSAPSLKQRNSTIKKAPIKTAAHGLTELSTVVNETSELGYGVGPTDPKMSDSNYARGKSTNSSHIKIAQSAIQAFTTALDGKSTYAKKPKDDIGSMVNTSGRFGSTRGPGVVSYIYRKLFGVGKDDDSLTASKGRSLVSNKWMGNELTSVSSDDRFTSIYSSSKGGTPSTSTLQPGDVLVIGGSGALNKGTPQHLDMWGGQARGINFVYGMSSADGSIPHARVPGEDINHVLKVMRYGRLNLGSNSQFYITKANLPGFDFSGLLGPEDVETTTKKDTTTTNKETTTTTNTATKTEAPKSTNTNTKETPVAVAYDDSNGNYSGASTSVTTESSNIVDTNDKNSTGVKFNDIPATGLSSVSLDVVNNGYDRGTPATVTSNVTSTDEEKPLTLVQKFFKGIKTIGQIIGKAISKLFGEDEEEESTSDITIDATNPIDDISGALVKNSGSGIFNTGTGTVALQGSNTKEKMWNFLTKTLGLSRVAASGAMGNAKAESSIIPKRLEWDYGNGFPGFDSIKTAEDMNRYTTTFVFPKWERNGVSVAKSAYKGSDGNYYAGIGLHQWTGPRSEKFIKYATSKGLDLWDLGTQLQFFRDEANESYPSLFTKLNAAKTPREASDTFLDTYEMYSGYSKNGGKSTAETRGKYAQDIYDEFINLGYGNPKGMAESMATEMSRTFDPSKMKSFEAELNRAVPELSDKDYMKDLGFGEGMTVNANVDSSSTDGKLAEIFGLMAEWYADTKKQRAESKDTKGKDLNATTNENRKVAITNNQIINNMQTPKSPMKDIAFKDDIVRRHNLFSYRHNLVNS